MSKERSNHEAVLRPYQSTMDLELTTSSAVEHIMPRAERSLTHLQRYILRERGRQRVNTDAITGRARIGKPGLVRG